MVNGNVYEIEDEKGVEYIKHFVCGPNLVGRSVVVVMANGGLRVPSIELHNFDTGEKLRIEGAGQIGQLASQCEAVNEFCGETAGVANQH